MANKFRRTNYQIVGWNGEVVGNSEALLDAISQAKAEAKRTGRATRIEVYRLIRTVHPDGMIQSHE